MSLSPPIRRLSTSSQREQDLINAYEAEEERIINVLSRKLEEASP
jgi:coiled-coil domain-containing protein 6